MNDEQFNELKQMIIHIHSDVEWCLAKVNEIERKLIMSTDKNIDPSTDDIIGIRECYSPINEKDKKQNDESLNKMRGYEVS